MTRCDWRIRAQDSAKDRNHLRPQFQAENKVKRVKRSSRSPSVWPCRWSSPPRRCQGGPCDKRSTIARCPDPRDMSIIKKIVKHTMISPCCCDSEGRPPRNHSTCECTSCPPPPPSGCQSTRPHGGLPLGWHGITYIVTKHSSLINILHRLCHFHLKCKILNRYNEDMIQQKVHAIGNPVYAKNIEQG